MKESKEQLIREDHDDKENVTGFGFSWIEPVKTWQGFQETALKVLGFSLLVTLPIFIGMANMGHKGRWDALSLTFFWAVPVTFVLMAALFSPLVTDRMSRKVEIYFGINGSVDLAMPPRFLGTTPIWARHKRKVADISSIELHTMRNNAGGHYRFKTLSYDHFAYCIWIIFRTGETECISVNLSEDLGRLVVTRLNMALQQARTAAAWPRIFERRA